MYATWWKLGLDTTLLAFEAQSVIALRMAKLAASEAAMQLATGASHGAVVAGYRRKVRANHRRLSRAAERG
ncbi:hypothetical protein [Methylorubrum extorquens]